MKRVEGMGEWRREKGARRQEAEVGDVLRDLQPICVSSPDNTSFFKNCLRISDALTHIVPQVPSSADQQHLHLIGVPI